MLKLVMADSKDGVKTLAAPKKKGGVHVWFPFYALSESPGGFSLGAILLH